MLPAGSGFVCGVLISCVLCLCLCDRSCDPLNNLKVTIYSGANGPEDIVIKNGLDDLEDAYRIEITNQNVPVLCKHTLQNLPKLHTLVITSSRIKKIEEGAFENLPSLRNLVIVDNDIKKIVRGAFGDLLVRKLNLSNNAINSIEDESFENMINLEVVDLNSNDLKEISSDWFRYTPKLYRIDLMHNKIVEIPEGVFSNLVREKNKKDDLEIWLADNKIRTVHGNAFKGVQKLESLWLSYNKISSIGAEVFANVQHIHTLFLDNNDIGCLSDEFLDHLRVTELDVDSNPMSCDCLKKIKRWSAENGVQLQSLRTGLKCLMVSIDALIKEKGKDNF